MRILKQIRQRTVILGGEPHAGWLPPHAALPPPTPQREVKLDIRILKASDGYILEWEMPIAGVTDDTWHQTIADAEHQAAYLFGIQPDEWIAESVDEE